MSTWILVVISALILIALIYLLSSMSSQLAAIQQQIIQFQQQINAIVLEQRNKASSCPDLNSTISLLQKDIQAIHDHFVPAPSGSLREQAEEVNKEFGWLSEWDKSK